jgi:hypothetical protein
MTFLNSLTELIKLLHFESVNNTEDSTSDDNR